MSALSRLELDFQDCMLRNNLDMQGQVVSTARAGAAERVRVYVEAYRLRLLEVLQDNYTGLHGLLGDEQFDAMGRAYIDAHPSTHPSVRWFSRHLEGFLKRAVPYAEHPYLAEMAAFEWAQGLVFDAADEPVAASESLASVPPDAWAGLRFTLHAAVQTLGLRWNVPQVWQALEAGQTPELEQGDAPLPWLLWRAEFLSHWRSLNEDEAWSLDAVGEGKNFAELCEGLCQWHDPTTVAMQAASLLKRWMTDGLITAVRIR
ncbi:MAG TPA: DNA-binding domain-containing protein [Gammaproteobacteria bacterium]|nr:DNA-binding domain-containing protein [Gammaproteobacteria bacterium]